VSRLGIEGKVRRDTANSNAKELFSFVNSIALSTKSAGVVIIDNKKYNEELRFIAGYLNLIRSDVRHDAASIASSVTGMMISGMNGVDPLIQYAFAFGQKLTGDRNALTRERWRQAVGRDPAQNHVRLFSLTGQTVPEQGKFLKLAIFSMVLSDFIGNGDNSRLRAKTPTVRLLLLKQLVPFNIEYALDAEFSTLAFCDIVHAFALALIIERLPQKDCEFIKTKISFVL
jgi:hypothetical protein